MRLSRVHIGDFGIIRNQTLDNINPGVVVIGGLNRAGKSTFMHILRHIAWGFPRDGSIPPATVSYEVECDFSDDSDQLYNVRINGYGDPVLNIISQKGKDSPSISELYRLDQFTYHRIFTINLGELRSLPEGLSNKDGEKLQSILLGAGFGDIIRIPFIESEFLKEADKIGGKNGKVDVKQFKEHHKNIERGMQLKRKALKQVGTYQERQEELKSINDEIKKYEGELDELNSKVLQLDLLRGNYDEFRANRGLLEEINHHEGKTWYGEFPLESLERIRTKREQYLSILQEYENHVSRFQAAVGAENIESIREKLKKHENDLRCFQKDISGINQKIKNCKDIENECSRMKMEIVARLTNIDSNWGEGSVIRVKNMPTDQIDESNLDINLEEYRNLDQELNNMQQKKDLLLEQRKLYKEKINDKKIPDIKSNMNKYLILVAVFVFAGIPTVLLTNWYAGLLPFVAGIMGLGIYFAYRIYSISGLREEMLRVERDYDEVSAQINAMEIEMKKTKTCIDELEKQLRQTGTDLGLNSRFSTEALSKRFHSICDLKERIHSWENQVVKAEELHKAVNNELKKMTEVIKSLSYDEAFTKRFDWNDLITESSIILDNIETWYMHLEESRKLEEKEKLKDGAKKELCRMAGINHTDESRGCGDNFMDILDDLINKGEQVIEYRKLENEYTLGCNKILQPLKSSERIKSAFSYFAEHGLEDDESIMNEMERLYAMYVSYDDIERNYIDSRDKLDEIERKISELKDRRQSLSDDIIELAATENLENAHREIDEARKELKLLAEDYAVYKTSAFILNKVQKNFMDRMKDTVLNKAADVFSKMTNGEYERILPPDDLTSTDFEMELKDGRMQTSVNVLSRGTREELYMAMRISRIKDTEPRLPVIIDDSFVNFDSFHMRQGIQIVSELGKTNQVFILTCHPELVEAIHSHTEAQYWKLDKGIFSPSKIENLLKYLSSQ